MIASSFITMVGARRSDAFERSNKIFKTLNIIIITYDKQCQTFNCDCGHAQHNTTLVINRRDTCQQYFSLIQHFSFLYGSK